MNLFKGKINFIYLVFIVLGFFLFQISKNWHNASPFFYGFAENKETEINLDQEVQINTIYVTPGEEVSAGQLLMEVQQASIDLKINTAHFDLEQTGVLAEKQEQQILDKIAQLEALKTKKTNLTEAQIQQINKISNAKQSLINDLESITISTLSDSLSSTQQEIELLQNNLDQEIRIIDVEVQQLKTQLKTIRRPTDIAQQKLQQEMLFHKEEQEKLMIYAPTDGLIGNIHCKKGEYINAFTTLITFYERNPTIVKGFIHESLLLQVKIGDSLTVVSSLHPSHQIKGTVIGLGSRIIEIPERLRKIPELKTYGREVLIEIPPQNPFLQKEKVMLNALNANNDLSWASMIIPQTIFNPQPLASESQKK